MSARPPLTLPQQFLRMCRKHGSKPKVADSTGMELTGLGLLSRSLVLRRLLLRDVLASDDQHVGLLMPPSVAGLVANAATTLAGRVAVNLNYTLSSQVLNACIRSAGIKHVLTSRRVLERFPLEIDAHTVFLEDFKDRVRLSDKLVGAWQGMVMPVRWLDRWLGLDQVQPNDLLTIIFTSGSTGQPKGVMLSYENVRSNVEGTNIVSRLVPEDVFLGVLPFFHAFGFTCTVWAVLSLDVGCAYHFNPLEAQVVAGLCQKRCVSFMIATPTLLRAYLKRCSKDSFPALNVVVCGAEKLSPTLADAFEEQFGVRPVEGYGTTECSPLVTVNVPPQRARDPQLHRIKEGTVGRPLPGVRVKVINPETGQDLPAGQAGLLCVAGCNVMQGYWQQPDKTANVIRNGWYNTGDMASIDEEGFVTLTGRLSRFSKLGGEMVPHELIEEKLAEVLRVGDEEPLAVVTAIPDERKGERLVVLHRSWTQTPASICRLLQAAGLPNLWIPAPEAFFQVDEFPLLGTGKIDLHGIQQLARAKFGLAPLSN